LIHHITYGVFRIPSFLAFLNRPFIFGPLGGGEHYPFYLKKSFKKRHILIELFRDFANKLSIYNPLLRLTYKNSILIACKNRETLKQIPSKYHNQCIVNTEIGLSKLPKNLEKLQRCNIEGLKLLYVGRLVYWKGLHLVLEAFSILKNSNHRLTVIGSGKDKKWLKNKATELNINEKISWIDRVPQDQLFKMYQNYDLMVFPSLREAGGNVVIEAIAHKLPVMCLQLGGPGEHIIEQCGIVISTKNKSKQKIIIEISEAIKNMDGDREALNQLSAKAQLHAKHFMLDNIVSRIYDHPILQTQVKQTFKLV
jgi:glycosyltransferase involved in cell wall biosynthesis